MKGNEFFLEASKRPPFSKLHPMVASFFKQYLEQEKVIQFNDQFILNTHFPPYPSPAFDRLADNFSQVGDCHNRRLYSVAWAVTNKCDFHCWHCYNAGRSREDVPFEGLKRVASDLQKMGAVMITLTGGEPLLRHDLEKIVGLFDERNCLILGTTGSGLDPVRARDLKENGLFGVGISLDSASEEIHDHLRGVKGAFRTAVKGLQVAASEGLYPYLVSVATHGFLKAENFWPFLRFAKDIGALEVHLLEPSATGRLAGKQDALLSGSERQRILEYQAEVANNEDLPILSSYTYLESPEAFGCGAGLTHLYVDGSGEVCPCQLVPISFGNILIDSLAEILERMGQHFSSPRAACCGKVLAKHIPSGELPAGLPISEEICERHLSKEHKKPRFFKVLRESQAEVGQAELKDAYDHIHESYDQFWLDKAGTPIETLVARLPIEDFRMILEAGCGTGYATALLSSRIAERAHLIAVDLSDGMLEEARKRLAFRNSSSITLKTGDALDELEREGPFDLIFSSWVLGYIPLAPFFAAAYRALQKEGLLAFIVHKENSPKEPLEIFGEIIGRNPSALQKRVAFDFPRDLDHLKSAVEAAGFELLDTCEDAITFQYSTPEEVLEHLLKSGAGTAFYEALDPNRRTGLEKEFLEILAGRHQADNRFDVIHDYLVCVARRL